MRALIKIGNYDGRLNLLDRCFVVNLKFLSQIFTCPCVRQWKIIKQLFMRWPMI